MRRTAHWLGVILGVYGGLLSFRFGMQAFFVGTPSNFSETIFFLMNVVALLSLLPLSIFGIRRPRTAAFAIAVSWVAYFVSQTFLLWPVHFYPSPMSETVCELWEWVVIPLTSIALLLFGSFRRANPSTIQNLK
jgi:hypothetical protein